MPLLGDKIGLKISISSILFFFFKLIPLSNEKSPLVQNLVYSLVVVLEGKGRSVVVISRGNGKGSAVVVKENGRVSLISLHNQFSFCFFCFYFSLPLLFTSKTTTKVHPFPKEYKIFN